MSAVANKITPQQDHAYTLYKSIENKLHFQAKLFLEIGKDLLEVRDKHLYQYMGEGGFDTFKHFVEGILKISKSHADAYIRVYEYYVLQLKVNEEQLYEFPLGRLLNMLSGLKKREDKEAVEILDQVKDLTYKDYRVVVEGEQVETSKPVIYKHDCGKWVVEFHEEQICSCDNIFHLVNRSLQTETK